MNRDAQAILADFGQKIGIENIAFDEDGNCQLGVDEFVFTIEHPDDTDTLTIRATVCEIPAAVSDDYFARIVELNLASSTFSTAFLGADLDRKNIVMIEHLTLRGLDSVEFEQAMTSLVNLAEVWRDMLTARDFAAQPGNQLGVASAATGGHEHELYAHRAFPIRV
jgi:hypothetical protein